MCKLQDILKKRKVKAISIQLMQCRTFRTCQLPCTAVKKLIYHHRSLSLLQVYICIMLTKATKKLLVYHRSSGAHKGESERITVNQIALKNFPRLALVSLRLTLLRRCSQKSLHAYVCCASVGGRMLFRVHEDDL